MVYGNKKIYYFIPLLNLFFVGLLWINSLSYISRGPKWRVLLLLLILGVGVYVLFFFGWRSNNKYGVLGSVRGVAQTISYEIRIVLIIFQLFIFDIKFSRNIICTKFNGFILIFFFLSFLWVLTRVAETNRSPFDFSEGESELVSGFNVEYMGGLFTLIFLSEYRIIIFEL